MFTYKDTFASFSVPDLDQAENFYGGILHLTVVRTPEGLELRNGMGLLAFVYHSLKNPPAEFTILNFVVDNIDASVDSLNNDGVIMEQYAMEGIKTDERGIAHNSSGEGPRSIAWFKDPFGNICSLIQP